MTKKQKTYIKSTISFLAVVVCFFCIKACNRDFPEIKRSGTLRIVTCADSVNYFVQNDSAKGFQYELIKIFADNFHLNLDITEESNLQKSISETENGRYDILLRPLQTTSELKEQIAFSSPILKTRLVLIQNTNRAKPIRKINELENDTIYIERNSPYALRLRHLQEELGVHFAVKEYGESQIDLIHSVAAEKICYSVSDEYTARYHAGKNIDYKTVIGLTHFQAWGMSKNKPKLKKELDDWITQFSQTKDFWNLFRKYYK